MLILILVLSVLLTIAGYTIYLFNKKIVSLQNNNLQIEKNYKRNEMKSIRDLDMARRIQSGLLVFNKIQHKNFQLSAVCYPAEKIGGDFFLLQKNITNTLEKREHADPSIICIKNNKEETLDFAIGDVSGHGVASALVMILAKNTIDNLFQERHSPKKIMQIANKKLIEYTEGSAINFVTVFGGMLDVSNNKFTYSKAGHTAPLLFRKNGDILSLETEGVFLGMFANPEFEEKEITLERGDKLFLYTDGLNEAKNNKDELLGVQKLTEIVKRNIWLSGDAFFAKIMEEIKDYAGGIPLGDDITMVFLEVN